MPIYWKITLIKWGRKRDNRTIIKYSRTPLICSLSRLTKAFLGIPVTSGYIRWFFSKTGSIIRPNHRCMGDDLAENLFYSVSCDLWAATTGKIPA